MSNNKPYAIIHTGSKQYRVSEGDIIDVELLEAQDNQVEFSEILLYSDGKEVKMGAPNLPNHSVKAELLEEVKGPKVISFKYKRRKNYHRKIGHRQQYARVQIKELVAK